MQFKQTTVAPAGRNKYGNYVSSGDVTKKVVSKVYGGDTTTNVIGGGDTGGTGSNKNKDNDNNFLLFLSRTSGSFKGEEVNLSPKTDTIQVMGFVGVLSAQTFVGDMTAQPSGATPTEPANYGIVGIPDKGMTVQVTNNGTTNTEIKITINSAITAYTGILTIPCSVCTSTNENFDTDWDYWYISPDQRVTIWQEYQWSVSSNASSTYTLELTNDSATINCDSAGTILTGAVRPSCSAELYYGTEKMSGATFMIELPASSSAVGISCTTAGELQFGTNFQYAGTTLEVTFIASLDGTDVGLRKIMTITKLYPGKDGEYATSRWIVPSVSVIKYDPNLNTVSPEYISAYVMAQKGEETPYRDSATTIYYDYNTSTPSYKYSNSLRPNISYDYLCFALKNATSGNVFESETIPIIKNGKDGTSSYRLDLSNQNASINADKDGNILQGSIRPSCKATLYYGMSAVTNASYSISYPSQNVQGVAINGSTGQFTFSAGTASTPFTFDENSLEITVTASINSVVVGTAVMTIAKAIAGQNGDSAVSYWITLSADKVKVDPNLSSGNITPSAITAMGYKQVGENTPTVASDCTIKYGYNTANPTNNYVNTITVDGTKDYITFKMYKGTICMDTETVPILGEGKNGDKGDDGLRGASIRGPVNYYDHTTSRRWCNGSASTLYAEDALWIDVILKDDKYYYCNTSYNGSASDNWSSVSSNWTVCDQQFNFVATNVLLAKNANIDFLGSNQILLKDSGGTITGGAMGGNNINFWAGSSTPSNGAFTVTYDGTMKAKKGYFGNLEIGSGSGTGFSDGVKQHYEGYSDDFNFENNLYLTHRGLCAQTFASDEENNSSSPSWTQTFVSIASDCEWSDNFLGSSYPVYVRNHIADQPSISANTFVITEQDRYMPCIHAEGQVKAGSFVLDNSEFGVSGNNASILYSPVESMLRNLKVVFCLDSGVTPTISGNSMGYITVNGVETMVSLDYPLSSNYSLTKITKTIQSNKNLPSWTVGHWAILGTAKCYPLGFADGSLITKQPDTIYIYLKTT